MTQPERTELEKELTSLLNRHSAENASGTPDHILARYLMDCLEGFNIAQKARAQWRGESVEILTLVGLEPRGMYLAEEGAYLEDDGR